MFPDVDSRFKFCILLFGGKGIKTKAADFVFFAHRMEDLEDQKRHIALSRKDLALLNPNTRTCPIFRTRRDAELTKEFYRNVPILIDRSRKEGGNPWGIRFFTMFHQTNDAELFRTAEELARTGLQARRESLAKGQETYSCRFTRRRWSRPTITGRRASWWRPGNWVRQGQTEATTPDAAPEPGVRRAACWWVATRPSEGR